MRLTDQQNTWIMRVWGAAPGRDRLAAEKRTLEEMLDRARADGRDEAERRLGAVAALAREVRKQVRHGHATTAEAFADDLDALLGPVSGAVEGAGETADGQANDCTHLSATGVDTTEIGPGKVWRCDHCGLTWTDGGRRGLAADPVVLQQATKAVEAWANGPQGDNLTYVQRESLLRVARQMEAR